jgi:hypothetical protein
LGFCGLRSVVGARVLVIRSACVSAGVGGRLAAASENRKREIKTKDG